MKETLLKHRYKALIAVVLLLGVLAYVKYGGSKPAETITISEQELSYVVTLFGQIESEQQAELGFSQSGVIENIYKKVGQKVALGETIASLRAGEFRADIYNAQAEYEQALTEQSIGAIDISDAESKLILAKNELDTKIAGLYNELLSGDLEAIPTKDSDLPAPIISGSYNGSKPGVYTLKLYKSKANSGSSYRLSGLETGTFDASIERPTALGGNGLKIQFSEDSSYEDSVWIIEIPNTRSSTYYARKNAYDNAVKERDQKIHELEVALQTAIKEGDKNASSISQSKLSQARAQIARANAVLSDTKITAPFAGEIGYIDGQTGNAVSANELIATIYNPSKYIIKLKVPERSVIRLKTGLLATITLDASPEVVLTGTVKSIAGASTRIDGSKVYETIVEIAKTPARVNLRPGLSTTVEITTESVSGVLAVPVSATKFKNGSTYIYPYSLDTKTSTEKAVSVGFKSSNGMIEITDASVTVGDVIQSVPPSEPAW